MKKLLSLLLALCLCTSVVLMLASCDEEDAKGSFEELNEEEWAEALSAPNFENVTIRYEYAYEGTLQKQVVKATDEGVYRSLEAFDEDGNSIGNEKHFFEGENATIQRNLFLQTFLGLVEDRDNFEYNKDENVYTADDVEVRIDQAEGVYVTEHIQNGKLTFNKNGNVEKFVCKLTESVYVNGEKTQAITVDVTWTFSDYGTTELSAEEKAASTPAGSVVG